MTAFYNVIIRVCILTALAVADNQHNLLHIMSSRDALETLVEEFIKKYDVGYILKEASPADTSQIRRGRWLSMIESEHHNVCNQTGTGRIQDLMIVSLNVLSV